MTCLSGLVRCFLRFSAGWIPISPKKRDCLNWFWKNFWDSSFSAQTARLRSRQDLCAKLFAGSGWVTYSSLRLLTAYLIHIARLPLGSFRCRATISCLKQYIQGLQSNADYGNKHLASVLAFERLNFRETYAPDEGGNEVITNSGDHQAAAKPASSMIMYNKLRKLKNA